ncbi:MAG: dipeptidyl-peptidase-4 [Planctomycetota bacterium]|jgi:dipeptidyl-peptidase-4
MMNYRRSTSLPFVRSFLFVIACLALPEGVAATQGTEADYRRSESVDSTFRGKVKRFQPMVHWLPEGGGVWWQKNQGAELRYFRVDGTTGLRQEESSPESLGLSGDWNLLPPRWLGRGRRSGSGGTDTAITFVNNFEQELSLFWIDTDGGPQPYGTIGAGESRTQHTLAGHLWRLHFPDDEVAGAFLGETWEGVAQVNEASRETAASREVRSLGRQVKKPSVRLRIIDHNIHRVLEDGKTEALSTDGSADDRYLNRYRFSPDEKRLLAWQETVEEERRVPLIESSPREGLQPELQWMTYRKPGDSLPQRRPRLFDLESGKAIAVEDAPFLDSYSVGREHWAPDSSRVYCVYNQRGHQVLALRAIDASTGQVTDIATERSETFVDYSQKTTLYWLDRADQVLWTSERDGYNHIYRFDSRTGELINQVTSGAWVMRRVDRVDEEAGTILFTAMGIYPDQDPYFEHMARVNLDGTGLVILTEAAGTHSCTFNDERSLFIDRWSRVDHAPVTELRRGSDGSLVAELGRDDATELLAAGYRAPEPFVAKGRDGETDIYGLIIRPSNFDPTRTYPVLEEIYAGPHGQHVPKSWGLRLQQRRMVELGFILVQIDGMGTNWRSKAFHDVCWQDLKDAGLPDRIAWMRAAADVYPEMDLDNVGIYGGSAGGQSALGALLLHADFYDAAAADCGCHDNRMDKIWWNEAWMGRLGPHYEASANVTHVEKMRGKLLLTVGELDRNVDPASTMQVVDALIRADKDFELIVIPGGGHGAGGQPYSFRRRQDFFVRALYGAEPRR